MKTSFKSALTMLLVLALTGCSVLRAPPTDTPVPPTDTPLPTNNPIPTDTATPVPTDTPIPTDTPTNTPLPPTPNRTATAAARATEAVGELLPNIERELKKYNLTTDGGYLAWAEGSFSIETDTYGESRVYSPYEDIYVSDFVLQTDVTWETQAGFAGCGIIFRSNGDLIKAPQYIMYFMRLQGAPLWDFEYHKSGRFESNVSGGLLSAGALDDKQGSTNQITLVVQDTKMTAYGNGDRMSSAIDGRVKEGIIGFLAFQESGQTICTFENTWVWALK